VERVAEVELEVEKVGAEKEGWEEASVEAVGTVEVEVARVVEGLGAETETEAEMGVAIEVVGLAEGYTANSIC
jgi:hypothetical protein